MPGVSDSLRYCQMRYVEFQTRTGPTRIWTLTGSILIIPINGTTIFLGSLGKHQTSLHKYLSNPAEPNNTLLLKIPEPQVVKHLSIKPYRTPP